jgi:hypothetical protein
MGRVERDKQIKSHLYEKNDRTYTEYANGIALFMSNMSNQGSVADLENSLAELGKIYSNHQEDIIKKRPTLLKASLEMAYSNILYDYNLLRIPKR